MIEQMVQAVRTMAYPHLAGWPVLIALAVLCPLAWWLAHAMRGSRVTAVAAAAFLAFAVALTLARPGLRSTGADWSRMPSACTITDARPLTTEALLNLILLAPFAALAVLALGHPIRVAGFAVLVSLGIETIQAVYAVGTCDSSDLLRNGSGALVAAVLAAAVRLSRPDRSTAAGTEASRLLIRHSAGHMQTWDGPVGCAQSTTRDRS